MPLERGLSLREYALSGAADLAATEDELRRLEQEMGGLRLEMHQEFAGMRTEMARLETRLIKWSFAFWIGGVAVQSALISGLISYLRH